MVVISAERYAAWLVLSVEGLDPGSSHEAGPEKVRGRA